MSQASLDQPQLMTALISNFLQVSTLLLPDTGGNFATDPD